MKPWTAMMGFMALSGCVFPAGTFTGASMNAPLVQGPPIEDVTTSFDSALSCLRGKIRREITFAVGQVVDATGKETYADGGTGKFVTQGAGEMVQSSLFRAGVSVVNRRDPNISIVESNWGIRDIKRQVPVNFYISGSINSLDFIPGGGAAIEVAGVGPRFRQNRILVALDLTMTDAYTGRVVASVPLQKQIFTRESGIGSSTFFGDTLVQFDAGGMEREALHFALRQMLSFATFELLGQLMNQEVYAPCRELVVHEAGYLTTTGTADREALARAVAEMRAVEPPPLEVPVSGPTTGQPASPGIPNAPQPVPGAPAQPASPPMPGGPGGALSPASATPGISPEAMGKGQRATATATEAIRMARDSMAAADTKLAMQKAAEALRLSNLALLLLKEAAEAGYVGDEAEVAAVVVQQALEAAQEAGTAAARRANEAKATPAPAAPATTATPQKPGTERPLTTGEATPAAPEPAAPPATTTGQATPPDAPAPARETLSPAAATRPAGSAVLPTVTGQSAAPTFIPGSSIIRTGL